MKKIYLLLLCCSICISLQAQNKDKLRFQNKRTGKESEIKIGDKVLLSFNYDYCVKHPDKITTTILLVGAVRGPYALQAKQRVLRISDSTLFFIDGSHVPLNALESITKLSFAKQIARGMGIPTDNIPTRQLLAKTFYPPVPKTSIAPKDSNGIFKTPINKSILPANIRVGDRVLLAYDFDYYLKNRHHINALVINPRRPKNGKIFYGKERILRITDSSLVFNNGTHAHFNSLLGIRRLSFGKSVLRTIGALAGGFIVFYSSAGIAVGLAFAAFVAPEYIIISFVSGGAMAGGIALVKNNNNRIKKKYLLPFIAK